MKIASFVVCFVCVIFSFKSYSGCTAPASGIISWWRAETNAWDTIDGNHGTLAGNATYGTGKVGSCFVFDGNRDGVNIGVATNLQITNITIEAWIKRSSSTDPSLNGNHNGHVFSLGTGGGGYAFYVKSNGKLAFGKLQVSEIASDAEVVDTGWHHVAVAISGSTVNFYVDGIEYTTAGYSPGTFSYAASGYIGAWEFSGLVDNSFYGSIDELAVYNRALTLCEIQALYCASTAGKCVP